MEKEKVVDKLRKLFALANDRGATEAEAQSAMAKAQELLAAHKLSMSDVEVQTEKTGHEAVKIGKRPWQGFVYWAAAQICFCDVFQNRGSIIIVGKPSDIIATKCLAEYLVSNGERMAKSVCSGNEEAFGGRGSFHAFKVGYAHRIHERAIALVAKAKANKMRDESTGNELILHPLYARAEADNAAYLRDKGVRVRTKTSSSRISNGGAYHAGREAGNSVSLTRNTVGGGSRSSVLVIGNK